MADDKTIKVAVLRYCVKWYTEKEEEQSPMVDEKDF
jgi:hypothetical protein